MAESIIKRKSRQLAIDGISLCKYLQEEKKEFVLSKQFLRSVTSVGANVREAVNAQSKPDLFINYLYPKKNVTKAYIGWSC